MISVVELSGPTARDAFAKAETYIDAALHASFTVYTIHDIWQMVTDVQPRAKLLMIYDDHKLRGAAITRVAIYSACSVYEIMALGGDDMKAWFPDFHCRLIEIAKRDKCKYMVESGREGWGRYLKDYGWRDAPRTMFREIA